MTILPKCTPRPEFLVVAVAGLLSVAAFASADGSETWNFDLETEGEDVFWTSPTSVDPDAPTYLGEYEITLIEVTGIVGGFFPVGPIDVTDEVPEEDLHGSDTVDGPAPTTIVDDAFVYPEPPDDPGFAATVRIELDQRGFGLVSITEITLGTIEVEVDGFGTVPVDIQSVRVVGIVTVTPQGVLGDINGDGVVDSSDLLILLSEWGECDDEANCPADLNGDGVVDSSDLLILLSNWG